MSPRLRVWISVAELLAFVALLPVVYGNRSPRAAAVQEDPTSVVMPTLTDTPTLTTEPDPTDTPDLVGTAVAGTLTALVPTSTATLTPSATASATGTPTPSPAPGWQATAEAAQTSVSAWRAMAYENQALAERCVVAMATREALETAEPCAMRVRARVWVPVAVRRW